MKNQNQKIIYLIYLICLFFYELSDRTKERVHLEAFKTFKTDKILANKNSTLSDYNELIWVSIGSPRLIEMPTLSNQTYNNT